MAVEKISMSDGINLNIIKTEQFKSNYLSFNFVVPLDEISASLNALIPQILISGTRKHPTMAAIKRALDDLYAAAIESRVYKRGEYQVFGMAANWLDDVYAIDGTDITRGTIDMLSQLIFDPYTEKGAFGTSYTEVEKSNLIDTIKAKINNKTSYAIRRCQEEMCRGERFGIAEHGNIDDIMSIDPDKLYKQYKHILRTAQIEIFYIGKPHTAAIATELLSEKLRCVEREPIRLPASNVIRKAGQLRTKTEDYPVTQGKLSLGFRTGTAIGDTDYAAFPLFAELYGGSPLSKLFMNVRERLSLCYYCRAIPESLKGIMIVASGIEITDKEKAQNEILAQLKKIQDCEISDDELAAAKKSLTNDYKELSDSPASLEAWYLTRILAGQNDTPESVMASFEGVTKEDIAATAKKVTLDTVYFMRGVLKGNEVAEHE